MSAVDDRRAWEDNAVFWVKIMRERKDRFRDEVTDIAVRDSIGNFVGQRILDAGCGEGYLARAMVELGAEVVGVDRSRRLIDAAQAAEDDTGRLTFVHGDLAELDRLALGRSFDVVVANHVVNDLADPAPVFKEFAGALRRGGSLIILMLHPCFYATRRERDRAVDHEVELISETYFSTRRLTDFFTVADVTSPAPASRYLRPLEDYVAQLVDAGFVISSLKEPHPTGTQLKDAWWRENFRRPLFMLVKAEVR